MEIHKTRNFPLQDILKIFKNGLPSLLAIALFEIVSIQIYNLPNDGYIFIGWILSLALSGLYLGFLSDYFSRKAAIFFTLISGFILLTTINFYGASFLLILLLGLTFNPIPIARASIIDNFPHMSKVQLIAVTFIAQFLPWCFFYYLTDIPRNLLTKIVLPYILINLLAFVFFRDNRNIKTHIFDIRTIVHKGSKSKVYLTLFALFFGQVVFFLSDTFLEFHPSHYKLYSSLGVGSLIGTCLALLYRKIPHLSVLTLAYGMGILFSIVPLFSVISFSINTLDPSYQTMLVANLGGFYLPFVYDAILSFTSPNFRGTLCGVIELLISAASVISLLLFKTIGGSNIYLFTFIIGLFTISMFSQRMAEKE